MSIKLTWANAYNANVTGFRLYRSTNKENVYDPANKIADLETSTLTYDDSAITPDVPYFYGVESLTPLGTMQAKIITAVQYMNEAGPGSIKIERGNFASGLLALSSASFMPDFWELGNLIQRTAIQTRQSVSIRAGMSAVPGYPESLVGKFSIDGRVVFMPADYRNFIIHSTAAGRQAYDEAVVDIFKNGVDFEYQGYPMRMELMDLTTAMTYYVKWAGGPINGNGWIPRAVEKPIPAHDNHYVLVKDGSTPYRIRASSARPYLQTAVASTLSDPFTAGGYCYPLWVVRPVA